MKNFGDLVLDSIMSGIDDIVLVCDKHNRIEFVNSAFERVTGQTQAHVLGQMPDFYEDEQNQTKLSNLLSVVNSSGIWQGPLWLNIQATQAETFLAKIQLLKDIQQQAQHYVYILQRSKNKTDQALKQSQFDPLTGLPNRLLFQDRTQQAIIAANRVGKSVAVLLFGLDRFTIINQGLGHAAGDKLLIDVAKHLSKCIRGSDTVARTEGDNFALLLQVTAVDDSVIVAEKVLKSMQTPFKLGEQNVTLTASIGISLCPTDSENTEELLKHSSSALYHAKTNGGNQYQFFANAMNDKAKSRIKLENNIRRAIEQKEFMLYYQPKVSSESKKIVGAEALIRWCEPSGNMISPVEFIPVAEETGLIQQIGTWVLEEACRQTKQWQKDKLQKIKMSVNVSAHQFRSSTFLATVKKALKETKLKAQYIELEITESMLMNNPEQTIEKLKAIRELGCHLSIDDFGTGYSSLSYLTKFPITTLKIDRAFVYDIETNKNMAEVAKAIIGLSQGLELEVVAEGAENIEHVNFLKENGCDMVQGFYYSRPLPAEEFEKLLKIGSIEI